MDVPGRRSLAPLLARVLGIVALITVIACLPAAVARADGDPASDVLATQPLFLPWDADVPVGLRAQLNTLLQTADRAGYSVRIALIESPADLGSVTALWRRPQAYADFLAQELSLVYRGPLLIVMPNGFGLAHFGLGPATVRAALAGIPVPHTGSGLAGDALTSLERLARTAGHPLAVLAAPPMAAPHTPDTIAWIVFALGGLLIASAWTASLRAQGLRSER
jgi:hypothetical protein